jgi:hypothetical protein
MQPNRTQTDARTRPQRRIPGAYLVHVCVRTDAADVLRLAAGAHFLFARWRCPEVAEMNSHLFSEKYVTTSPTIPTSLKVNAQNAETPKRALFFKKHSLNIDTRSYEHTYTLPMWAPSRDRIQETKPPDLEIEEVTHVNLPPLWVTKTSNLGFDPWWTGGITALLAIQPQVGSRAHEVFNFEKFKTNFLG